MPVGGIESGLLSQAVGVPWTVVAGALVCAGAGLATWWAVRHNPLAPPIQRVSRRGWSFRLWGRTPHCARKVFEYIVN